MRLRIEIQILLDGLNALTMLLGQLLKGLLAKDIVRKQSGLPLSRPIPVNKLCPTTLTQKELLAIICLTVLDYVGGAAVGTLFLGIPTRIDRPLSKSNLDLRSFYPNFLQLDQLFFWSAIMDNLVVFLL